LLFSRIHPKIKSKTQPFVYCGRLEYVEYDENKTRPVHIISLSLDPKDQLDEFNITYLSICKLKLAFFSNIKSLINALTFS
jgi:hypothetical protein